MHRFVLTSRWRLEPASAERVWHLLTDVESWPQWWRHVRAARVVAHGRSDHVGDVAAIDWTSALGYGLRLRVVTTLAERGRALEARAEGDVRGHGTWLIEPVETGAVDVTYRWDVVLHRRWMRWLAFLLRPLFEWNHFAVMREGARGMAHRLGCRLASLHESTGSSWP